MGIRKLFTKGVLAGAWILLPSLLTAQTTQNATKALNEVATSVGGLFENAWKVALSVAAVIGIVGAIVVYSKWQQGDPQVTRHVAGWFGSAVAVILMGVALRAIFA